MNRANRLIGVATRLVALAIAGSIVPAQALPDRTGPPGLPGRPDLAEIVQDLWETHDLAKRAAQAQSFEEIHDFEADLDSAFHALELLEEQLPKTEKDTAHELLGALFEVVSGLHEAAERSDPRSLATHLTRLSILIGKVESTFRQLEPDPQTKPDEQGEEPGTSPVE